MAPSKSITTAPSITNTNTNGTRKSSRITVIKLKQAEKEASSRQAKLQLSKVSQAKIATTKARKQLLDQVISFCKKLADPALESELGKLLKQFIGHGSDEGLKTAINKIDFTTSISLRTSTHKRSREATGPNVTDSVKPSKKARIKKEHVSDISDRVIAAPRSRSQATTTMITRSSKVITAKTAKRKSEDTNDSPPSKKSATTKPSKAKKVTKPKTQRTTRSKQPSTAKANSQGEELEVKAEDEVPASGIAQAVEAGNEMPASGIAQAVEAEDEAQESVIAQSSAQAASQSPGEVKLEILQYKDRVTQLIGLGVVMRRPGAVHGDNLDLADPSIRSIMNRQLSEPENALDDRILALLFAPSNKDCEADNWTIDFEDCSYAYESAGDIEGLFVRESNTAVEPFEYKSYYRMTHYWKTLRRVGIGLWDDDNGFYGCCGVTHSNNAITLLGRHHAGDQSDSGLESRLNRLYRFHLTHPDVPYCAIDPLDESRIQYGIIFYQYSMAKDPAHFPSAAWEGDDDEENYD